MREITVLIKPAGHNCNLNCSYCFYNDEVKWREKNCNNMMSNDTAESIITKVYDHCKGESTVHFMFQGGEPMLAGTDFFIFFTKLALDRAKKRNVDFCIQTNGTLIDDTWCKIFKKYNYSIGVSLDGEKSIHNKQRCNSFDLVINGIELLKKYNIKFTVLTVVTALTDAHKLFELYDKYDIFNVQTIIRLNSLSNEIDENSISPREIASFKKRVFNLWLRKYINEIEFSVREIENLFMIYFDGECEQCGLLGNCTPQLVVEADGTCYPCDFYCLDEFNCGNINDISLPEILKTENMQKFMSRNIPLNELCKGCEVFDFCRGGCKRYRSLFNAEKGYCPQKDYLMYALEKLRPIL